ncbi:MAG: MaoC family dehydratase N-terminal domain-containing protein [Pseudomonadota bacterium]
MVDVEELKARFLNLEYDTKAFEFDPAAVAEAARLAGETRPEFTDPTRDDFQVIPPFLASFASGRRLPIDFPSLGGISMDGGKAVTSIAPVRADTKLTGKTHLHDIYDKSGRSGRMIFIVARTELLDEAGTHYATVDARQVIREKPDQ